MEAVSTVEQIVDLIEAKIEAEIATYLAQVETNHPGLSLPVVTSDDILLGSIDVVSYVGAVSLFIIPGPADVEKQSRTMQKVMFDVDLFLAFREYDKEDLYRIAMRYLTALWKLFDDDPTLGGSVQFMAVTESEYYEAVIGNSDIKGGKLTLDIEITI